MHYEKQIQLTEFWEFKVWVFKGEVLPKEEQTIPVGAIPRRKGSRKPQQFEDRSNENS